ncbi:MAG: hypothetical protein R3Y06_11920 [Faecalibacterium sp.]
MQTLKNIAKKDIPRWLFCVLVVGVVLAKLALGYLQNTYIWVGGAPIDDELMFAAAQSISAGQWLGDYTWLTLSKQMFFAVWLALCNALHLPYLIAGQALLCAASYAAMRAFAPVLPQYKTKFLLFAALCFSPAAAASFTLRVYRDNIFPSLCVLFFAGMIGAALRYHKKLGGYALWLALAGVGMGLSYITREDGIWLLPFALVASVVTVVFVCKEKALPQKAWRCAAQLLPYALTLCAVLIISGINYAYYGVFTTSDFSSGSFAAAYGAMTRITHTTETDALVPVPADVRAQLYAAVPELALLEEALETDQAGVRGGYYNEAIGDYQAGAFYWVLRKAASEAGVYADAQTAADYWQSVADAINAAIADGILTASSGVRNSTTPIITVQHVLPTLAETLRGFAYCITFQDTSVYYQTERSIASEADAALWADYLGSSANTAAIAGSDAPYYAPIQLLAYRFFNLFRYFYMVAVPLLFALACYLQGRAMVQMCRAKQWSPLLLWLILFGVFGMAFLRCAMIAFMEVAAFNIGTYVMYLATVHPLLIIFAVVGVCCTDAQQ